MEVGRGGERRAILHLGGFDELNTMEEVSDALDGLLGANDRRTVATLRPARANTQAVTVVTKETEAQKLLEKRFISVGLVRCRVQDGGDTTTPRGSFVIRHGAGSGKCSEFRAALSRARMDRWTMEER
ncbi:hypothetical protein GWI33_016564 [Rhynchophorus ferrugineus]|uniref:Uncharacterized protein n=1 Tax=Rhynchophorus ferrugineus TaxID=354439 RepID=A0A834HYF2_RHYFE|nr:hypothetical protein GWI33_016564 [Rhynchophorus ferrugineus]